MCHENDVAEIAGRSRAPGTDQRVLLRSMFDITAPEVGIVRLDARGYVVQRQPILFEERRVDHDLELFCLTAPGIYLTHPGDRSQLRLDHPFVQILQIHRAHGTGESVLKQLAERRGGQPENRLHSRGQRRRDLLQSLAHKLAREVHRHRIVENNGHHRKPKLR